MEYLDGGGTIGAPSSAVPPKVRYGPPINAVGPAPFGDQLKAWFVSSNSIASGLADTYYAWAGNTPPDQFDPDFNAARWLHENLPEKEYRGWENEMAGGLFDDTHNATQVQVRLAELTREREQLKVQAE